MSLPNEDIVTLEKRDLHGYKLLAKVIRRRQAQIHKKQCGITQGTCLLRLHRKAAQMSDTMVHFDICLTSHGPHLLWLTDTGTIRLPVDAASQHREFIRWLRVEGVSISIALVRMYRNVGAIPVSFTCSHAYPEPATISSTKT